MCPNLLLKALMEVKGEVSGEKELIEGWVF